MKYTLLAVNMAVVAFAQQNLIGIPAGVRAPTLQTNQTIDFFDGGMKEYGRGKACTSDKDQGGDQAVFIIKNGGTLQNAIIGADAFEGVHCLGACTIKNVWFKDVCEDAITLRGNGPYLIEGGGAQHAKDKVIQHNGRGTVTVKNYKVGAVGKLYRSCGNCSKNGATRNIVVDGVSALGTGTTSDLVGINSNYGDEATISRACGTVKNVCQEFIGIEKDGNKESPKRDPPIGACKGPQGQLKTLPAC
ncbi:Pectate lyase [Neofusicoccum parvum]|uniref:Pectate lyase n=1 Tax=Botryosphaeria parva (strain UCR-NP2) TaxID=1287680 RepID=R1ESA9_BOTPV|nr:putative pectate lyase protein [Neofusicoccum parvum UCRNP2]GME56973.1 Pectate lyase [Neofusicoccum parvum]